MRGVSSAPGWGCSRLRGPSPAEDVALALAAGRGGEGARSEAWLAADVGGTAIEGDGIAVGAGGAWSARGTSAGEQAPMAAPRTTVTGSDPREEAIGAGYHEPRDKPVPLAQGK